MNIKRSKNFSDKLSDILIFISKDSGNKAKNFKNTLKSTINSLTNMPYKFRKSIYFDNENIRDFIFKGYCIPYFINEEKNEITLLNIIKWDYLSIQND